MASNKLWRSIALNVLLALGQSSCSSLLFGCSRFL